MGEGATSGKPGRSHSFVHPSLTDFHQTLACLYVKPPFVLLPMHRYAYKDGAKPAWTIKMTPDNPKDSVALRQLIEALNDLALQLLPTASAPAAAAPLPAPPAVVRKKPPPPAAAGIHLQAEVLRGARGHLVGWALKTGISKCKTGAAVEVKLQSLLPLPAGASAGASRAAAPGPPPPSLYGGSGYSGQQLEEAKASNVDAVNGVLGSGRVGVSMPRFLIACLGARLHYCGPILWVKVLSPPPQILLPMHACRSAMCWCGPRAHG